RFGLARAGRSVSALGRKQRQQALSEDLHWRRSLVQPHVFELGAEKVARRHLPAHHHLVGWNDAMPPQQRLLVGLLEQALLECPDQRLALLRVALADVL